MNAVSFVPCSVTDSIPTCSSFLNKGYLPPFQISFTPTARCVMWVHEFVFTQVQSEHELQVYLSVDNDALSVGIFAVLSQE